MDIRNGNDMKDIKDVKDKDVKNMKNVSALNGGDRCIVYGVACVV